MKDQDYQELLHRRLSELEKREAVEGFAADPSITIEIEDIKEKLNPGSTPESLIALRDDDSSASDVPFAFRDQELLRWYFSRCAEYDNLFQPHAGLDEERTKEYMIAAGLACDTRKGTLLTKAGVLLCCKRGAFPLKDYHSHIKFQSFLGEQLNYEPWGPILFLYRDIMRRLEPLLESTMGSPSIRTVEGVEKISYEYPRTAIIEALVNALIHRDYEVDDFIRMKIHKDRIEIVNPGISEIPPEILLTHKEALEPGPYKRNPRLIEALNKARLNQREGGGILRIREALEENRSYLPNGELALSISNDESRNRYAITIFRRALLPPLRTVGTTRVSIGRLPVPGRFFVGRDYELRRLDQAWADPHQHLVSIVAWGGVGKSALVHRWLAALERADYRGADCVYGWSFYSQGTEERLTSADQFIDAALGWFGDPDPSAGSPRDRGLRLAELVRRQRTLLVLDGVEPLQHPPGPLAGRLKDPGLAALVKTLASSCLGLCVVTTRELIDDVSHLAEASAPRIDLEHLTPEAGAELLQHLGIKGTDRELRTAAEELGGHALALTLLGTYLRKACGGEVRKRGEVALGEADQRQGGHAYRVMAAYERWLGPGPELAILRLLGLFDRPAEGDVIATFRSAPVIPELNESLVGIAEKDWQWALSNLRDCELLRASDPGAPATLDANPLVRSYFGDELQKRHPEAWRAGQERLYEHYRQAAPELPDTLEEMMPLYAAVVHGCRAGKYDEAFNEVHRPRIRRVNEHYQIHKLGAFGADLVALSGFFARPWDEPVASLTDNDKAWLLNAAGFELRALGRLAEAVQPMRAGLEMRRVQENWKDAARIAGNLSELTLTLGDLSQAVASAEESVELADRSNDAFLRMAFRTALADALHQAGRLEDSAAAFREAEAMQAAKQPQYPRLYSLQGYQYCDLLLGRSGGQVWSGLGGSDTASGEAKLLRKACQEVVERANQTVEWANQHGFLLDIALDDLTLGLAHFGLALSAPDSVAFAPATEHLDRAVAGLRQAGQEDFLPRGLLARAALRRARGDRPGASADLTEALEIAERGSMLLHQCDAHLGWTLLHVASGAAADARRHLAVAKALVEKTGYHRRDAEVAFLEERLAAL